MTDDDRVLALADPELRESALRALVERGPSARTAVLEGLRDGRWQVRRGCALWCWLHPAPEQRDALVALLRDPRSKVRQAALVALAHGVGAAEPSELVPLLLERALHDDSLRLRRQAVSVLAWHHAHPDLEGFFCALLEAERDEKLRGYARLGVARGRAPC